MTSNLARILGRQVRCTTASAPSHTPFWGVTRLGAIDRGPPDPVVGSALWRPRAPHYENKQTKNLGATSALERAGLGARRRRDGGWWTKDKREEEEGECAGRGTMWEQQPGRAKPCSCRKVQGSRRHTHLGCREHAWHEKAVLIDCTHRQMRWSGREHGGGATVCVCWRRGGAGRLGRISRSWPSRMQRQSPTLHRRSVGEVAQREGAQ
eukprot:scaffold773_cov114-Isochrysis_galbana.AAC.4